MADDQSGSPSGFDAGPGAGSRRPEPRRSRGRIRDRPRARQRRLRHRLPRLGPRAASRRRDQGVHARSACRPRRAACTVSLRSPGFADTFASGLRSFLSEARLLASFDHRRWSRSTASGKQRHRLHGDAVLLGPDAEERAPAHGLRPGEAWLTRASRGAPRRARAAAQPGRVPPRHLARQHPARDDGRPVLLDFGSARRVMADSPQSLTAILKPQFAPLEQYAEESGGMRQGPWTDLYALGATLYFVLTGRAPTPSVVRAVRDVLPTLASQAGTTIPSVRASLLATIDWTLALAPEQRPQSVLSVRRALSGDMAPPPPSPRQLGAPVAVAPDSAPAPVAAARTARAHDASPERPRFSRLAATFWGPAADLDPPPSRSRRRAHLSVAASLALAGTVALGWGAWTLNRPSLPPSIEAVSTPEAAVATTTKAVATSAVASMPALAPTTPSAMAPVALWVKPEAQQASGAESGVTAERRVDRPASDRPPPRRKRRGLRRPIAIGRRHVPRSRRRALPPSRHAPRRTHATATGCSRGPGAQ